MSDTTKNGVTFDRTAWPNAKRELPDPRETLLTFEELRELEAFNDEVDVYMAEKIIDDSPMLYFELSGDPEFWVFLWEVGSDMLTLKKTFAEVIKDAIESMTFDAQRVARSEITQGRCREAFKTLDSMQDLILQAKTRVEHLLATTNNP